MTIKADHRHLYLQVIDRLKLDIDRGVYVENEKLPSEFELSKSLGVSRATLREALRLLEEENVIVRRHGVGTFVNTKPMFTSGIEHLTSISAMIEQAGKVPGTKFISAREDQPTDENMDLFQIGIDDNVLTIERVRTADGEPVVYCIDTVPSRYLPNSFLTNENLSIFSAIEKTSNIYVTYAITHIDPIGYHDKYSEVLNSCKDSALLVLTQEHYDENDRLVLYSKNYFRADKFSFHVVRKRM